jgi:hypothetical protein
MVKPSLMLPDFSGVEAISGVALNRLVCWKRSTAGGGDADVAGWDVVANYIAARE